MNEGREDNEQHTSTHPHPRYQENHSQSISFEQKNYFPASKKTRNSLMNTKKFNARVSQLDENIRIEPQPEQDYKILKEKFEEVMKKYIFRLKPRKKQMMTGYHQLQASTQKIPETISQLCIRKQPLRVQTQNKIKTVKIKTNTFKLPANLYEKRFAKSLSIKKKKHFFSDCEESPTTPEINFAFTQIQVKQAETPTPIQFKQVKKSGRVKKIPTNRKLFKNQTHKEKGSNLIEKKSEKKRHKRESLAYEDYKLKGWQTKNFHREEDHDNIHIFH